MAQVIQTDEEKLAYNILRAIPLYIIRDYLYESDYDWVSSIGRSTEQGYNFKEDLD